MNLTQRRMDTATQQTLLHPRRHCNYQPLLLNHYPQSWLSHSLIPSPCGCGGYFDQRRTRCLCVLSVMKKSRKDDNADTCRVQRDSIRASKCCGRCRPSIARVTASARACNGGDNSRGYRHLADTLIQTISDVSVTCIKYVR